MDRGLFVSTYYRTYKEQNNKNHSNGEEEFFTKPEVKSLKPMNYDKLEDDGFVAENTYVESGDIIIGKCMPNKIGNVINNKDNSISFKNNDKGFIDRNVHSDNHFCTVNGDGYNFCKVRVRSDRIPTIGDKVSSRSGQKGTCGILYRQEDMPFTKDGIVPDLIMNPHAIPSRMTIGQLIECIMGKACLHNGTYGDSTPFTDVTVEKIADILESCGMERYGNEIMYNSRTGTQMNTLIFIGPTYYQRLKHMTADKVHSRSNNGPIVLLTRQPSEGRARDGGGMILPQWKHRTSASIKKNEILNATHLDAGSPSLYHNYHLICESKSKNSGNTTSQVKMLWQRVIRRLTGGLILLGSQRLNGCGL